MTATSLRVHRRLTVLDWINEYLLALGRVSWFLFPALALFVGMANSEYEYPRAPAALGYLLLGLWSLHALVACISAGKRQPQALAAPIFFGEVFLMTVTCLYASLIIWKFPL